MPNVPPMLELTQWDRFVFSVSLVLSLVAAAVRLREGKSGAWIEFRWVHRTIGLLALFYSLGYVAVLSGVVDRLVWSRFFAGVSMFAWIIVWVYPPVLARRISHKILARTNTILDGDK